MPKKYFNFVDGGKKSGTALLKKRINDLLFVAHKFLALFQTIRLTPDVEHGAVMQNTIQDGGGDGNVGKDFIPLRKGLVGDKDSGRFLVAPGNQVKEQVCALDVHGKVADLIDDKHPVVNQDPELVG